MVSSYPYYQRNINNTITSNKIKIEYLHALCLEDKTHCIIGQKYDMQILIELFENIVIMLVIDTKSF